MSKAEAQLRDELGLVCEALGNLLGADVGDLLRARLDSRARQLAADAADRGQGADLLVALGGRPPMWWRSPLGLALTDAMSGDGGCWTHQEAADVLGVTRGTVGQLVSRGTLERCAGGGVRRGSVLARLGRLHRRR